MGKARLDGGARRACATRHGGLCVGRAPSVWHAVTTTCGSSRTSSHDCAPSAAPPPAAATPAPTATTPAPPPPPSPRRSPRSPPRPARSPSRSPPRPHPPRSRHRPSAAPPDRRPAAGTGPGPASPGPWPGPGSGASAPSARRRPAPTPPAPAPRTAPPRPGAPVRVRAGRSAGTARAARTWSLSSVLGRPDGVPPEARLVDAGVGAEPAADRRRVRHLHPRMQTTDRIPDGLRTDPVRARLGDDLEDQLAPGIPVLTPHHPGRSIARRRLPLDATPGEAVGELRFHVPAPAGGFLHGPPRPATRLLRLVDDGLRVSARRRCTPVRGDAPAGRPLHARGVLDGRARRGRGP